MVGDRERIAGMLGINVGRYQLYVWMLSGGAVALVGCIQAYYLTAIGSSDITLLVAIQYFAMVIVGGRGSPGGSVIGAVIFITLPFELQQYGSSLGSLGQASNLSDIETILYGVLIIVFLVIAPDGLAGLLARAYAAGLRQIKQHRASDTHRRCRCPSREPTRVARGLPSRGRGRTHVRSQGANRR